MNIVKISLRKKLLLVFSWVILFVMGLCVSSVTIGTVQAASCTGSSCHGYNPNSMGCDADATTIQSDDYYGALVERRHSQTCNAAWERTKNISGSSMYTAGSIRYGCANYCYHFSVSTSSPIAHNQKVYTSMVAPHSTIPTLACGRVSSSGISTPCTYYCPGQH